MAPLNFHTNSSQKYTLRYERDASVKKHTFNILNPWLFSQFIRVQIGDFCAQCYIGYISELKVIFGLKKEYLVEGTKQISKERNLVIFIKCYLLAN